MQRLRADIDSLNAGLLRLLEARGRTAQAILSLKRELGEPAYDPQREQQMLFRLLAESVGPYSAAQIAQIFLCIFAASRELDGMP